MVLEQLVMAAEEKASQINIRKLHQTISSLTNYKYSTAFSGAILIDTDAQT